MSEFTAKKLKEARVRAGLSQDEAANLMNVAKRAISEMEAGKRSISADEQRLTAKYSSFLKLLKKISDREVEDVY